VAAAALQLRDYPPLIMDLEAVRDDDHVLALYRVSGHWGALAKSNHSGLRYRDPVYRSLRELVMSYFDQYLNDKGEKTLRRYSRPVNLLRFDALDWISSADDLRPIADYLVTSPHVSLLKPELEPYLARVNKHPSVPLPPTKTSS
jgi:hypothetical protein